jgi:hypothetical protein
MTSPVNCLAEGSLPFVHSTQISVAAQPPVGGIRSAARAPNDSTAKTAVAAPSANKRVDGELNRDHPDSIRITPIFCFYLGEREPYPQIKS